MIVLRLLLFPFAILYNLITSIRNQLYDLKFKPSVSFDIPVISVGNLAVGGTGKTPMVEHLIRLLKDQNKIATLSRGYGRQTKGFRVASPTDIAATLGDEPCQFYRKFRDSVVVSVGEERALAIPLLVDQFEGLQVILLDDAYQHRKVRPSFSILLTDYHNPFYNDFLLPAGRLRENRKSAERADVIVMTKCPAEIQDDEMMKIEQEIRKYGEKPVFFATIHYVEPEPFATTKNKINERVVLVSGIANSKTLVDFVGKNFQVIRHFSFKDHHQYSTIDVDAIVEFARKNSACILTTEKDAVKLDHDNFRSILSGIDAFYVPIEPEFIKSGRDFDEMILDAVNRAQHKKDDDSGLQD
jgi:tetraacyldisaccharide 4'-kinase